MKTTAQKMSAFKTILKEELCSQNIMYAERYQQNLKDISRKQTKKLFRPACNYYLNCGSC